MTVRVMVVDDSSFFRKRLTEILNADSHIEVIGSASDGAEAVEKVTEIKPDVITMDIEMPVMDGITAVRQIMAKLPTPILMFSTLTTDGAKATLDALDAGAVDFLPKKFEDIADDKETAKRTLCSRVRLLGAKGLTASTQRSPARSLNDNKSPPGSSAASKSKLTHNTIIKDFKLVMIGTSTGGPVALQQLLSTLPAEFPVPIVLIQHMPASFTPAFAKRLDGVCKLQVKQADDGDVMQPGSAFLAPGGSQMTIGKNGAGLCVRVSDGGDQTYKPSVDITFSSAAETVRGKILVIVLTGMGADGREGARLLKQNGSTVWVQDEASCVVYGMPMAIDKAGLADEVMSLTDIAQSLVNGI